MDNDAAPTIVLNGIDQFMATKSADWSYEKEYRKIVDLEGRDPFINNIPFYPMSERLRLREVIIGAESDATIEDVEDALSGLKGVNVFQSRLAFHSFKVTKQEEKSLWNRRKM